MACAYAKYTGKLGVCLATSGPGGIHLLNGLYDAKLDGQPVLAITGHHFHDLIDTHAQQDVNLDRVFMDVAVYNTRVMGRPTSRMSPISPAARRWLIAASRTLISPSICRSRKRVSARSATLPGHTSDRCGAPCPTAGSKRISTALPKCSTPARRSRFYAGAAPSMPADELEEIAEILAAPIIKALLGKAAVPDDSPYTTGGIGLLGTKPSQDAIESCDTLLMVGTSFPYIEFLPKPGQARAVQIDLDPARIGLRYPVEVGLVGDSRRTLRALLRSACSAMKIAVFSKSARRHGGVVEADGRARHAAPIGR